MVPKNLHKGTIVFCAGRHVENRIEEATIQKPFDEETNYYGISSGHYSFGSPIDCLFLTEKEAREHSDNRTKEFQKELSSSLKTKDDVLNYLFGFVSCESATYTEITVLKEKTKELFGVSIEN